MARNAARLKMGFYPLPISEAVRLRALLEFTGAYTLTAAAINRTCKVVPFRRRFAISVLFGTRGRKECLCVRLVKKT